MKNKTLWKVLGGLVIIGGAAGAALAYAKKCKDRNEFAEDDYDDLFDEEEEDCPCETERTYTVLSNTKPENNTDEDSKETEDPVEEEIPETSETEPEEQINTTETTEETAE